jgi:hypothetical protein
LAGRFLARESLAYWRPANNWKERKQQARDLKEQNVWHPEGPKSHADPDGPPVTKTLNGKSGEAFQLPKASLTVFSGRIDGAAAAEFKSEAHFGSRRSGSTLEW